jgi:hypothetical protein
MMNETTFETQSEWLNGKSKSEVTREIQLKWFETEDGALLRADSVVAIYPRTHILPLAIKIQVENTTYTFRTYPEDTPIDTIKSDVDYIARIISDGTYRSDTLRECDITREE